MTKKILAFLLIIALSFTFTSCNKKGKLSVFDKDGNLIAELSDTENIEKSIDDENMKAFLEYAVSEAVENVKKSNNCKEGNAKSLLLNNCNLFTSFDTAVYKSVIDGYESGDFDGTDFGSAFLKTDGSVLALFSSDNNENFALKKLNPCSTFKPLSVYAPALESNKINWSTIYEDSPYKTLKTEGNENEGWPKNANGKYSMTGVTVYEGIKKSLNTVAVKCLSDYGVINSIEFLNKSFGLSLSSEQKKAALSNNDEVIGNVALGYISEGCSPLDMAGYYEIFSNGGKYTSPHTVTKITDSSGKEIYTYSLSEKRVIKETTAFVMNKLLQGVLESDATGSKARVLGVPVGGKTGTGEKNDGNWFVGFTPEYVCAVFHGTGIAKNTSPEVFSKIMSEAVSENAPKIKDFPSCAGVKQIAYCRDSGKKLKYSCSVMETGYYIEENIPDVCNIH